MNYGTKTGEVNADQTRERRSWQATAPEKMRKKPMRGVEKESGKRSMVAKKHTVGAEEEKKAYHFERTSGRRDRD